VRRPRPKNGNRGRPIPVLVFEEVAYLNAVKSGKEATRWQEHGWETHGPCNETVGLYNMVQSGPVHSSVRQVALKKGNQVSRRQRSTKPCWRRAKTGLGSRQRARFSASGESKNNGVTGLRDARPEPFSIAPRSRTQANRINVFLPPEGRVECWRA